MNLSYEKKLKPKGYFRIAGLDEAGRGSLAGPLVAGCVMVDNRFSFRSKKLSDISMVDDSKKLSPAIRQKLFSLISKNFVWSVGIVTVVEINRLGINQANRLAMFRAYCRLKRKADFVLIDFLPNLNLPVPHKSYPQADGRFFVVAAASIVAKVYRDQLMIRLEKENSSWHFSQHKGYGTKLHQQEIKKYGLSAQHRLSFCKNILL